MAIVQVKVSFSKKFKKSPVRRGIMAGVGRSAAKLLRDRVFGRGQTADGPLPRYSRDGWAWVAPDDQRFRGGVLRNVAERKGGKKFPARVFEGGYGEAKRAAGAGSRSDGTLSGDLSRSMKISVRPIKGGTLVRVFFGGSSVTSERRVQVSSVRTKKTRTKTIRKRVRNRDKALALTTRTRGGTRTRSPRFALLKLTRKEQRMLLRHVRRQIRLFAR